MATGGSSFASSKDTGPDSATTRPDAPARPRSPRSQAELPTTAATLAMGNLEGGIHDSEARISRGETSAPMLLNLARLYLAHGRITSRLAEYDRAAALVALASKGTRPRVEFLLAEAEVATTFHRFPEALAKLDRAAAMGEPAAAAEARMSVELATGHTLDAERVLRQRATTQPTLEALGLLATLRGEAGHTDEAEQLFVEAQDHFRDVAPFPVAWLWFQQGLMWQKAGANARARELYEAALARLPMYAPAAAHLATLELAAGETEKALARLRALVAASDDPEYEGQLAEALRSAGHEAEAKTAHEHAAAAFDKLLDSHPEAFADHAARFYLGWGGAQARALQLAEKNLAARKTAESEQLVVEAALAAGVPARACTAAGEALALAPDSERVRNLAWKAYNACGQPDQARAVIGAGAGAALREPGRRDGGALAPAR